MDKQEQEYKYKNSFAYHIEVELGEPLDKYWDYEKNTVNPYHIKRGSAKKVWIKCQEKDYHGSYEIQCRNFIVGSRCSYCSGTKKVHPLDSFGQYLRDNNMLHLWSNKNNIDPFTISKSSSSRKVLMLCNKVEYHQNYEIRCTDYINGHRCSYCGNHKVHPLDSFGYHNFDKVMSWHTDNNISPFKVSLNSHKKYKFICHECNHEWGATLASISYMNSWCPQCKASKGEKRVSTHLDKHNVSYIRDEPYFKDLLSDLGNPLRPDFILPEHRIWIEYDGEFHFRDFYKDGHYEILKEHDKRKDEYASKHGWKMIRIPYTKFDEIENILDKYF